MSSQPTAITAIASEPDAGVQGILDAIDAIGELIESKIPEQEENRRISDDVVSALHEAGAFTALKPSSLGSKATTMVDLLRITRQVGLYDTSTSWVTTLVGVSNYIITLFGEEAQSDIFKEKGLNTLSTGIIQPSAEIAKRVEGGYRVNGQWFYNSGSWHSDWAWLGVLIETAADQPPVPAIVFIPRADYDIRDTWFTMGMRGTESNCVTVENVFVPDSHIVVLSDIVSGNAPGLAVENRDAITAGTLQPIFALGLIGPILGAGSAALDYVLPLMDKRDVGHTIYKRQSDSTGHQIELAQAATLIDTAHLHAFRAAAIIDDAARKQRVLSEKEVGVTRADTGWAAQCTVDALAKLINVHGAGSFAEKSPVQRFWRNANTACRHAAILPLTGFEGYGKTLVGQPGITPYE